MVKILCCGVLILLSSVVFVHTNFLPEDSLTDDAEQLDREKRDNLFERFLKTLPFFRWSPHSSPSPSEESEDNDEKEDPNIGPSFDMEPTLVSSIDAGESVPSLQEYLPMSTVNLMESQLPSATFLENSSSYIVTPTPTISIHNSVDISSAASSTIFKTSDLSATQTLQPTPIFSSTPQTYVKIQPSTAVIENTVITSTLTLVTAEFHTSLPPATQSIITSSSNVITPTPSMSTYVKPTPVVVEMEPPIIQMMIMKEPQLPDESGYADELAKVPTDNAEVSEGKHVFYSTLFIPVMSGLFGALCITIVITIVRCVRRRRMRKVRYYGGKPESTLYGGLDHMGLLSDMSSDEE